MHQIQEYVKFLALASFLRQLLMLRVLITLLVLFTFPLTL